MMSKQQCKECEALKHDLDGYMQANKEMLNKEWQRLSDEEIAVIWFDNSVKLTGKEFMPIAKAIEQKLKEKNHGTT